MSRTYSRRAVLGVFGVGLAALTGATSKPSCAPITGSAQVACRGPLSLSGPSSVEPAGSNPRFVCRNEGAAAVQVAAGEWELYRYGDGWRRHAVGQTGETETLGAGEETAWVLLLLDDGRGQSLSTASTTTRYVGPVSVRPGRYAFAVRGAHSGAQFEATARFTVE
ncbi:hypothetical protein [Halobacterium wangiae]|uniref:hypothetical protein n=1 Tax=Halobacterium wangiae TaxID=2902623 RepID=UPI001E2FF87B|nr:hypothetical protein [Halobacterium wangiae]